MKKHKNLKSGLLLGLLGLALFTLWGYINLPDHQGYEVVEAMENGENIIGDTVEFEVASVEYNEMSGYSVTSTDDVIFMNGPNPYVEEGDQALVKVSDYGYAFGNWIIVYDLVD